MWRRFVCLKNGRALSANSVQALHQRGGGGGGVSKGKLK